MNVNVNVEALEPKLIEAAGLLGLLAQPARLKVLCNLVSGEQTVQALTALCDLSQPAMSHHLAKLRAAGVVATRREAQSIFYRIKSPEAEAVLTVLHQIYCADIDPVADR